MTLDRMKLSAQTVRDNIAILEEVQEPDDAGYYLQLEHEKFVLECIEKQIPKKPIPFKRTAHDFQNDICKYSGYHCEYIRTFNHEYQYTDYKCPCCDKRVTDGTPKYCANCGQALDWSETE